MLMDSDVLAFLDPRSEADCTYEPIFSSFKQLLISSLNFLLWIGTDSNSTSTRTCVSRYDVRHTRGRRHIFEDPSILPVPYSTLKMMTGGVATRR
jgi:hypothetical protein